MSSPKLRVLSDRPPATASVWNPLHSQDAFALSDHHGSHLINTFLSRLDARLGFQSEGLDDGYELQTSHEFYVGWSGSRVEFGLRSSGLERRVWERLMTVISQCYVNQLLCNFSCQRRCCIA